MTKQRFAIALLTILVATSSFAQMHDRDRGARMGSGMGGGMGMMDVAIAPDGTAITARRSQQATGTIEQIVAVNPTGTVAWSWRSERAIHFVRIAGNLVLGATAPAESGTMMQGGQAQIVALSLGSGTPAWTLAVRGTVMALETAPTQIYALVAQTSGMTPGVPSSGMSGKRSLVAISMSGTILWTMPLDN